MSKLAPMRVNLLTEPFRVIAFDPGGTTGLAICTYVPPQSGNPTLDDFHLTNGEFKGDHHNEIFSLIQNVVFNDPNTPLHLVCEPFDFRQFARAEGDAAGKSKLELVSREYIGVVRLCGQLFNVPVELSFKAGEAKTWCPDEKLDKLGWLERPVHPNRHKNDAKRQLVKYLVVRLRVRAPLTTKWTDDATD